MSIVDYWKQSGVAEQGIVLSMFRDVVSVVRIAKEKKFIFVFDKNSIN